MEKPVFRCGYILESGYIRFTCEGVMEKGHFLILLDEVKKAFAENGNYSCCLVDLRNAQSAVTNFDRVELATRSAHELPALRMATIAKKLSVDSKLYENATNNRGLRTLITENESEAVAWLVNTGPRDESNP